jgi:fucokinase
LLGALAWEGAALVADLQTTQAVALAADVALHQAPMAGGGYVTRIFGLHDDPKQPWDAPWATFLNRAWPVWLARAGVTAEQVWPDAAPEGRTLWNARLYPLAADREESLRLALPLQAPEAADAGWRTRWLATPRLSLSESFIRADGERVLAELADVEDQVAVRRFYAAVVAERPAAQVAGLLGVAAGQAARRGELVGGWLEAGDPIVRLRGYRAIAEATRAPVWEDRAFGTLAAMIEAATPSLQKAPSGSVGDRVGVWGCGSGGVRERLQAGCRVRVAAAARIDFGGGWTDTPPYSLERGGTVLNAAVTLRGHHPIIAEAELLLEPRLVLESRDIEAAIEPARAGEVLAYADPTDPFALLKAALVLRGIVPTGCDPAAPIGDLLIERGGGLRLSTETAIPRGSGLGTSSIMAGAVLECLARLLAFENGSVGEWECGSDPAESPALPHSHTPTHLFDEVLCLEQMLTTGGGWQDQVGGLTGGIKLVTTRPGLPQQIHVEPVQLAPATAAGLRDRLLLVYTGQQRLAKNLLRAMMGRWMARDPEMVRFQAEIARLAVAMRDALHAGDLDTFGALLGEHWTLNKRMDPGCTNPFIDDLFAAMRPYVNGGKLAGAGGGGYAMMIVRSRAAAADLTAALADRYVGTPVGVWESGVPGEGVMIDRTYAV